MFRTSAVSTTMLVRRTSSCGESSYFTLKHVERIEKCCSNVPWSVTSRIRCLLYKNVVHVRQCHHNLLPGGQDLASSLLLVPIAVEEPDRPLGLVIRGWLFTLVHQDVIVAAQDDGGRVVRGAVTAVAYRVL